MTVSMDGLRQNAINAYNKLIRELKGARQEEGGFFIHESNIEEPLDDLRNILVTLAFSYQDGEDGWKTLKNPKIDSLTE